MNEVVKKETELEQQGLVEMSGNYFEQYGSVAAQTAITGMLIKFSKGDWLLGPDDEPLEPGTQFTAVMSELQIGWIKWVDSKPEEQIMGKVAEGFHPGHRADHEHLRVGEVDHAQHPVDHGVAEGDHGEHAARQEPFQQHAGEDEPEVVHGSRPH